MRFRSVLLSVGLFLLALILFFPYDSLVRWKLCEMAPALQYESLEASPWSGVHLRGVRYAPAPALEIRAATVILAPAGFRITRWRVVVESGESRVEVILSGKPARMTFHVTASVVDVRDFAPSLPSELRIGFGAQGEGAVSLRPLRVGPGAKMTVDRISGEMPSQSRIAQAAERALGMTGWASMWGNAIKEGRIEIETQGDALQFKSIHVKTDGEFNGSAEMKPAWPLSAARLRVQGQATLSDRTIPIDNTIVIGDLLSVGGG